MADYVSERRIRFGQCDPAGIMFFPRYLELCNDVIEDWCRDELGFDFAKIQTGEGWGLPTAHLTVDYALPSRIGEVLAISLAVRGVGKTSLRLRIVFRGPRGEERVRVEQVVVLTAANSMKPTPIPDELRKLMQPFHVAD